MHARCRRFIAVAKVHTGQLLILEYSPCNAEPQIIISVSRHDGDCAVLWLFIWKREAPFLEVWCVLSLIAAMQSVKRALAPIQRESYDQDVQYLVSGTPYVMLANSRA